MQISSSSSYASPFGRPLQANSLLANGHPKVQSIGRVARERDDQIWHLQEGGAGAAPLVQPQDSAAFSGAAMAALEAETASAQQATSRQDSLKAERDKVADDAPEGSEELSKGEQESVRNLKARDAEVRTHEANQVVANARAEIAKTSQSVSAGGEPESQESGNPQAVVTEQAGAQVTQKAEQQNARNAQALQMARRSDAYREISQATTGSSTRA